MPHEPLMQTLVDVIRQPQSTLDVAGVVGSLRKHGASKADIDSSANATTVDRFLLYRSLVHGRFKSALDVSIPRTIARIGSDVFAANLDEFIHQHASKSPYLRDVASEFVMFSSARWRDDINVPKYAIDLAIHELMSFEIAGAPDDVEKSPINELTIENRLLFQCAAKLVHYQYAVHRLPDDEADRTEPVLGTWWVLGYRDSDHRVRFLELTQLAAAVIQRLMNGESLREAATGACTQMDVSLNNETLAVIAALLEDLEQRNVFVGVYAVEAIDVE